MMKPNPVQEIDEAKFPRLPILLVDDEAQFLLSESVTLNSAGITHTVECQDSRDVMPLLSKQDFQGIVMDMSMPHVFGLGSLATGRRKLSGHSRRHHHRD